MLNDLLKAETENFSFVLMNFYTRESFLYKDLNFLLREIDILNNNLDSFVNDFINLFPFYFMFTHAMAYSLWKKLFLF